jgi:hypothetical protein
MSETQFDAVTTVGIKTVRFLTPCSYFTWSGNFIMGECILLRM